MDFCWHECTTLTGHLVQRLGMSGGLSISQAATGRPVTAEGLVGSKVCPSDICGGKSTNGSGYFPNISVYCAGQHFTVSLKVTTRNTSKMVSITRRKNFNFSCNCGLGAHGLHFHFVIFQNCCVVLCIVCFVSFCVLSFETENCTTATGWQPN